MADLDNDGVEDFVVNGPEPVTGRGPARGRLISGATGQVVEARLPRAESLSRGSKALVLGDIDNDDALDWGLVTPAGIHLLDPGAELHLDASLRLHALGLPRRSSAGPVVAAVSNNGGRVRVAEQQNIVLLTDDVGIQLLLFDIEGKSDGSTPAPVAVELQQSGSPPSGFHIESVGDVSGDGVEDYLIGVDDCLVFAEMLPGVRSGADGAPIWSYSKPETICRTALAAIGDLDEDGVRDVLVTGSWATGAAPITGWVEALSGKTGARIFRLERDDLHQ